MKIVWTHAMIFRGKNPVMYGWKIAFLTEIQAQVPSWYHTKLGRTPCNLLTFLNINTDCESQNPHVNPTSTPLMSRKKQNIILVWAWFVHDSYNYRWRYEARTSEQQNVLEKEKCSWLLWPSIIRIRAREVEFGIFSWQWITLWPYFKIW